MTYTDQDTNGKIFPMTVPYHKSASLYQTNAQDFNNHPLRASQDAMSAPHNDIIKDPEIAIIGGGFTGISAALNLAERGYDAYGLACDVRSICSIANRARSRRMACTQAAAHRTQLIESFSSIC